MTRVEKILGIRKDVWFEVDGLRYCYTGDKLLNGSGDDAGIDVLLELINTEALCISEPIKVSLGDNYYFGTLESDCKTVKDRMCTDRTTDFLNKIIGNCFPNEESVLAHRAEVLNNAYKLINGEAYSEDFMRVKHYYCSITECKDCEIYVLSTEYGMTCDKFVRKYPYLCREILRKKGLFE